MSEEYNEGGEGDGKDFGEEADAEADVEVGSGERTGIRADVGLHDSLAELVMSATKPAVEDACQRGLGVAAVGRSVAMCVFLYKGPAGPL